MKYPSISSSILSFSFVAVSVVAAALLFSIVVSTTPAHASQGTLWLFFISLVLTATSVFTCVWHVIRKFALKRWNAHPKFSESIRQSFLLASLVCLCLFLHTLDLFQVWDAFPLFLAFLLVEFFFQAEKRPHASLTYDPS